MLPYLILEHNGLRMPDWVKNSILVYNYQGLVKVIVILLLYFLYVLKIKYRNYLGMFI